MKPATYKITTEGSLYSLECIDGNYRLGCENVTAQGEIELLNALLRLKVPADDAQGAIARLRDGGETTITFDAKTLEPL